MPREWRFTARFATWRSRCATAEDARFLSDLAHALVDRRAIDWTALADRARGARDREIADGLRLVERLRGTTAGVPPGRETDIHVPRAVRFLIAVSTLQTACCLGTIALAWIGGAPIESRASQVTLAVSFAAAAVLVATAARTDRRSLFLVAVFCAAAGAFARPAAAALAPALSAALAPVLRGVYPEAFVPACLWRLAQDFPRMRRFTAVDALTRRLTAAAWILGAMLFLVNLAGAYGGVTSGPRTLLFRDHPANLF